MATTVPVVPGHSLGPFALGASLHECVSIVKNDRDQFPAIDLYYAQSAPVAAPINLALPENGLRLRFDGADQRLRLIEVLDFSKTRLTYKGSELVKSRENTPTSDTRPVFKRIYQIFEASYPGEYHPPKNESSNGIYVLSWTGIAFAFSVQHSAWAPNKDHITLLGSQATSPATHMAVFDGQSWPEARIELFITIPKGPRLSAIGSRPKDSLPAEIEVARITTNGRICLIRRPPALPYCIVLNETTSQDLIAELGPPDCTYKREERPSDPEHKTHGRTGSMSRPMINGRPTSQPSSYSSTGTDTFDTDFDSGDAEDDPAELSGRQKFWCYFAHGMDILVGPATNEISTIASVANAQGSLGFNSRTTLVVTKVVLHGNVPGSYAFNRHRRLRWELDLASTSHSHPASALIDSESSFEQSMKPALLEMFSQTWPVSEMGRGKVVNRTWGAGPSDSTFFLPDAGEELVEGNGSEQWLGNTRLYSFPGIMVEVLDSGCVSALTIY
nr:upf0183 protein [Quercus suber]